MKREFKFRVWDKKDKTIRKVTGINFINEDLWLKHDEKYIVGANFFEVELMQYTGLKDKNEKEIYEGDIVEEIGFEEQYYRVVFHDYGFKLKIIKHECMIFESRYHDFNEFDFNIIGNIYENPELLDEVE